MRQGVRCGRGEGLADAGVLDERVGAAGGIVSSPASSGWRLPFMGLTWRAT